MKPCSLSLSLAVVLGLTLPGFLITSLAGEKPKPVKVEKTWLGQVKSELRKEVPNQVIIKAGKKDQGYVLGYVADKDTWAKLWKTYRCEKEMPWIDFDKELVLVAVNSDPNQISIWPEVDDKGDLSSLTPTTLLLFTDPKTCGYQFALIKREGIKTIGGKAIAKD
jgi:hypothetical protein